MLNKSLKEGLSLGLGFQHFSIDSFSDGGIFDGISGIDPLMIASLASSLDFVPKGTSPNENNSHKTIPNAQQSLCDF